MRFVTKLSPAVKNPSRVNIFIDDEYSFSLTLKQVVDYRIKTGQALSESEILRLKAASEYGKLYQQTLEWLLSRPRSVKETRDHLTKKFHTRKFGASCAKTKTGKPFPIEFIEQIITELSEKNYLNDEDFVKYYLENRKANNGISLKKLKSELFQKGISDRLIEENLNLFRNDRTEISKIIAKKSHKYSKEKLIQYLLRQGFDSELIFSVLETDL